MDGAQEVPYRSESCLESHPGFYRLLMKGIFDAYVLWPFDIFFSFFFVFVMDISTGKFMLSFNCTVTFCQKPQLL